MPQFPSRLAREAGRSGVGWLTVLLLLAVLAPSVCLLWFMNQAVQNERLGARQKLIEAYRGHLVLAQERLQTYLRQAAGDLDKAAEGLAAPALFAKQVRSGAADAVICYDATGRLVYPGTSLSPAQADTDASWMKLERLEIDDPTTAISAYALMAAKTTNINLAARYLQAEARCLVKTGQTGEALAILGGPLQEPRFGRATDAQGRLIVLNGDLMALDLAQDRSGEGSSNLLESCKRRLLDYDDPALSSAQRRFLMHEFQRRFPGRFVFPTLAAEDLAARYVESEQPPSPAHELHATSFPGVWQTGSRLGRLIVLHQTERLRARLNAAVSSQILPADVRLSFLAPGRESENPLLTLAAGPDLPGWRMALTLNDQSFFEQAANQRIVADVWIGTLVLIAVVVLASLVLRSIREQSEMTQIKNDLLANVTHELKTPLSSMRLLVDTLIETEPLHEPTAREYLRMIARENIRLTRLIDNFLTFSKIERNKHTFTFNNVPMTTIIDAAVAAASERFNTPACRFVVKTAANMPSVEADADAMTVAVLNLLDNAYKYSGDEKEITLSAGSENGGAFLAVQDNGIGVPAGEIKRIFRRFYQVVQPSSPSRGGCGLGLSIVNSIVSAHGGRMRVESEPGRGSTFIISLPAARSGLNGGAKA